MERKRKELIKRYEFQIASGEVYGEELKKTINALRLLRSNHFVYNLNFDQGTIVDDIWFSEN